jgi:uncharacterized membrane protein YfcA
MRLGFVGFGALLLAHLIRPHRRKSRSLLVVCLVGTYASATGLAGLFSTAPIDQATAPSPLEASIHSILATAAGLSLSAAIAWSAIRSQAIGRRGTHLAVLILVVGFSLLFGLAETGQPILPRGMAQRGLYLAGLAWLLWAQREWARNPSSTEGWCRR